MTRPHTLPVPPRIISRAGETIGTRVRRVPFDRDGVGISRDLIAAALEELNAEPNRTLAVRCRAGEDGRVITDGLDRHLLLRGFAPEGTAEVIARVLVGAGIAMKASITDRRSHRFIPGVRLLPAWTWTIAMDEAGAGPAAAVSEPAEAAPPWTSLCPVCRAGRLDPSAGQRLFGVHEAGFFSCTSCGARFVPDNGKFRLAAIVHKRDPSWITCLNRSLSPDEWQAVALGMDLPAAGSGARQKAGNAVRKAGSGRGDRIPAGRLAVEIGERTLYFSPLPLQFGRGTVHDLYAKRREPLRELLRLPAYHDCAIPAGDKYRSWLDAPVGFFLAQIRDRRDLNYRKFLNEHGDDAFCTFMTPASGIAERRGVWVIVRDGEVCAVGESLRPFSETVNGELGSLRPAACYRDGNPERCRVNALVCGNRKEGGGLFVYPVEGEDEIRNLAREIGAAFPWPGQ